jgi:hypothetical protein
VRERAPEPPRGVDGRAVDDDLDHHHHDHHDGHGRAYDVDDLEHEHHVVVDQHQHHVEREHVEREHVDRRLVDHELDELHQHQYDDELEQRRPELHGERQLVHGVLGLLLDAMHGRHLRAAGVQRERADLRQRPSVLLRQVQQRDVRRRHDVPHERRGVHVAVGLLHGRVHEREVRARRVLLGGGHDVRPAERLLLERLLRRELRDE